MGNNDNNEEQTIKLKQLDSELREVMNNIRDERDVEKIREIMRQIEEIEPIKVEISAEDIINKLETEILPEAIIMREEIQKLEARKDGDSENCKGRKYLFRMRFYRIAFALIATLTMINICTISFAGFNIFKPIMTWTDRVFKLNGSSSENKIGEDSDKRFKDYTNVEDELDIKIYKPMNKRNDYILEEFVFNESPTMAFVSVIYTKGDFEINYLITIHKSNSQSYEQNIEKTKDEVEIYNKDGIDFYIIKNRSWYVVTWCDDNIDYVASGFVDVKEAKNFVKDLIK